MADDGTRVALLRGINVGGHNRLPMAALRDLASGLGWRDVRSLLASGNLVFRAPGDAAALEAELGAALARRMGLNVRVLVLTGAALRALVRGCPFDPVAGRLVHGFLLWGPARLDEDAAAALKGADEDLVLAGRCLWLHTPSGFAGSRLAARLPRLVSGSEMTARNLDTLRKLAAMLDGA